MERGLLRRRRGTLPWPFRPRRRPAGAGEAARGIGRRIGEVLRADDIPDPRDIALVSLLHACDILPDLVSRREIERCRPRIEQLRRMDLIGREVAGAVADIGRTVMLAVRARSARFRRLLLLLSVVAGLAATATLLAPRVPIPDRFGPAFLERLWFDGVWQQWSGYALLGLSGAGLAVALLMKTRRLARLVGYNPWRLAHAGIGLLCALALIAHTGFRLGANLNAALMVCYLAMLICGALAGIALHGAPLLRRMGVAPRLRVLPMRLHAVALLPLPALLIVHVLIVYLY